MSKLFTPHKVLGLFSSRIPLLIKAIENNEYYLISAVEHYFLVFRFSDLAIIGTSDRLNESIISITSTKNIIFCGCQTMIFAFKRAKHVFQRFSYEGQSNWKIVRAFEEDGALCGVSEGNVLVIWDIQSGEMMYSSQLPAGLFDVCQVLQPPTYTHKLLLVSKQGDMHLINYKTRTTLYMFSLDQNITCIHQTPDNDTVAVGFADGEVILHNVLHDKTVAKARTDLGAITSISFRDDLEELIMLIGSEHGHITMWNLDKGRNIGQSRDCHQGAVASLFCVPSKSMLVSNGPDNSIKVWNYDRPDGTPALHNSRRGHWLPPAYINYWPSGSLSSQIVSGGQDSVMNVFSTFEEKNNFSMGRAYLPYHGKKEDRLTREQYVMSPPRDISCNGVRDGFWDSMVVCHRGHRQATTWTFSKRCKGQHYLDYSGFKQKEFKYSKVAATRCAISLCGNFVVVGYSSGHLIKYNVQSGQERGHYGEETAHDEEVTGVQVALSGSRMVVVSADASGSVRMWDLASNSMIAETKLSHPVHLVHVHPNKDMVAVATVDGFVHLLQLAEWVVFWRLRGSMKGPVTAVTFAHNSERMIIADGVLLKTFDYVHQKMVDCFKVSHMVTNIVLSPNDSLLATTHEKDLGIYLWSLKTQCHDLKLKALPDCYDPIEVTPMPRVLSAVDLDVSMLDETMTEEEERPRKPTKPTVANMHASFCPQPSSYLAGLLNVDHIKVKSEMALRGVSSTAFFLPQMQETLDGIKWKDEENNLTKVFGDQKKRKHDETKNSDIVAVLDLHQLLMAACSDENYDAIMSLLKGLTATSMDHELRLLHPIYHADSRRQMDAFMTFLSNQLRRGRSLDMCAMCVAGLLRHNSDCLLKETRCDDDPLHMNEDVKRDADNERRLSLALMNSTVAEMQHAEQPLLDDLNQVVQMALLASFK